MIGGPKPRPTQIKILRGEQPKRINSSEPAAPEASEAPPDHLDVAAQECWAEMVPVLKTMRVFTAADRGALAMYCCLHSRWMWAKGMIITQGEVWRLRNGLYQTNPYMKIEMDCMSKMLAISEQFGMTPASRSRLTVSEKPESSSLGAFIVGKPRPKKTGT